jgi:uncharacterized protein HemX
LTKKGFFTNTRPRVNAMSERRSRNGFQTSLKSLFLLTLVVAAFFAGYSWATKRAGETIRAEQEARRAAEEAAQQAEAARQVERRLRIRSEFGSGVDDLGIAR